MLIRIRGGKAGIKEYLQTGRKRGRVQSRDELDERIILAGDLDATEQIYQTVPGRGERYLHITISFREDQVPVETLQEISDAFRRFALAAYRSDEYYYYCEAHIPRVQAELDQRTGQMIERKPHLHIVIPKVNLLSGRGLDPFGKVKRQVEYIDAFQEQMNDRLGLESPKDYRRLQAADRSEIIGRYSGDFFRPAGRELKQELLQAALSCADYDDFVAHLHTRGSVRVRNQGTAKAYLNLKRSADARGVNLKESVFSQGFLQLSPEERLANIRDEAAQAALPAKKSRLTAKQHEDQIHQWQTLRSREVKYLNSGNRSQWKRYQAAETPERLQMLDDLEQAFYYRWPGPEAQLTGTDLYLPKAEEISVPYEKMAGADLLAVADTAPDSQIGQLVKDAAQNHEYTQAQQQFSAEYAERLSLTALLNHLSHTHGINPAAYTVAPTAGGQSLQLPDGRESTGLGLLVEQLHLPPADAIRIIDEVCQAQEQGQQERARSDYTAELWKQFARERDEAYRQAAALKRRNRAAAADQRRSYKAKHAREKQQLYRRHTRNTADRKAALSLLNMDKVHRYQEIFVRVQEENDEIDKQVSGRYTYQAWLQRRAEKSDEKSLQELQRLCRWWTSLGSQQNAVGAPGHRSVNAVLMQEEKWSYRVESNGNVHYAYNSNEALIDRGARVDFIYTDTQVTETGLRFAMMKYGTHLKIYGSEEFKHEIVTTAARLNLPLIFTDAWMNREVASIRKRLSKERERRDAGMEMG